MSTESHGSSSGKTGRPSIKETFGLHSYRFTRGKWILLAVASVMVAGGLLLARSVGTGARGTPTSGLPGLGNSFAESRPSDARPATATTPAASIGAPDFSLFLVKGGLGAFIGFAIGFAIRSFVRLAIVMVGFYFLGLTLMSYAGWVEVHWTLMQEQFQHSVSTLGEQFTSFQAFLTGMIPSSGMAALGLALGLRKR